MGLLLGALAGSSIVEVGKVFFGFRSRFHIRHTAKFIERGDLLFAGLDIPRGYLHEVYHSPYDAWPQLRELLGIHPFGRLETQIRFRGFRLRFATVFDLPLEQYTAQLASAMAYAVTGPMRYPELLLGFGGEGLQSAWLNRLRDSHADEPQDVIDTLAGPDGSLRETSHFTTQGLDNLQVLLSARWQRCVRGWALAVTAVATILLFALFDPTPMGWAISVAIGVAVAGPASWLMHDLGTLPQRWKG